jgi:flagellar biosynthetic protein FliR
MISVDEAQLLAWVTAVAMPLFRVLGLMTAAPVLSSRAVPVRARVAIAFAVSLVATPVIDLPPGVNIAAADGWLLAAREVGIGLAIGFVARAIFAAFELAGEIIGLQMGFSYAGFFDPAAGQGNAIGRVLNNFAMLMFVTLNGPLVLMAAVIRSFAVFPAATLRFDGARFDPIALGADLFSTGLSIALPFVVLLLFLNVVLGVISRVAPQLNVFAIGFPVTIGAGLALFALAFPLLEAPLAQAMTRLVTALY